MSPPSTTDKPTKPPGARKALKSGGSDGDSPSVLSSLPSTRPQRPSARRAAARRTAAAKTGPKPAKPPHRPSATAGSGRAKQTQPAPTAESRRTRQTQPAPTAESRRTRQTPRKPAVPPVPAQGFEAEEQIEPGHPVQPPSGSELAVSLVELVGELAQSSLATGGRLLGDALKRLSGS
jgi:hypothetical protein